MDAAHKAAQLDESRIRVLREQAAHAARHSYAPYSNYHVGAAVLLQNGHTVTGCNVENVSYRLSVCAEQAAIARAVSEYGARIRVVAVAVANGNAALACQPCGACRQTIAEFADGTCPVFYPGDGGKPGACTLADLLPAAFSADSLT